MNRLRKCCEKCIPRRIYFYVLLLCLNFFDMGLADARSFPGSFHDFEHFYFLMIVAHLTFIITAVPLSVLTRNISAKNLIISFSSLKLIYWIVLFRANHLITANIIAEIILGLSLFLFCLTPIYVAEIVEAKDRGKMICIISCGYWILQMRLPFATIDFESEQYASKLYYISLFSLAVSASTFLLPQSPVWLLANEEEARARKSLEKLRGKGVDIENELILIKEMLDGQEEKSQIGLITLLRSKRHLLKNIGIMMVIFFLREPIKTYSHGPIDVYLIINDCTYVLGQLLCCCIVECVRRKVLLLVSLGSCIPLLCMSVYSLAHMENKTIYAITFSINSFLQGLGLDLLPYVLMVELIPYPVRRIGVGISVSMSFAFIVKHSFLWHMVDLDLEILYITTIATFLGAIFIYYKMPETKGVANETKSNTQNTHNNSAITFSRMGNEETGSVNIEIQVL